MSGIWILGQHSLQTYPFLQWVNYFVDPNYWVNYFEVSFVMRSAEYTSKVREYDNHPCRTFLEDKDHP